MGKNKLGAVKLTFLLPGASSLYYPSSAVPLEPSYNGWVHLQLSWTLHPSELYHLSYLYISISLCHCSPCICQSPQFYFRDLSLPLSLSWIGTFNGIQGWQPGHNWAASTWSVHCVLPIQPFPLFRKLHTASKLFPWARKRTNRQTIVRFLDVQTVPFCFGWQHGKGKLLHPSFYFCS